MSEMHAADHEIIDAHEARRLEIMEEQGIINHAMAEDAQSGSHIERIHAGHSFSNSSFAEGVRAEVVQRPKRRVVAAKGIEVGAITGMDQARRIANEEAATTVPVVLSNETKATKERIMKESVASVQDNFILQKGFSDLPLSQQNAQILALQERMARKKNTPTFLR